MLINKKRVRLEVLSWAQERSHKFKRVSPSVYRWLDKKVSQLCRDLVKSHPSVGVTVYPPTTDV